MQAAHLHRASGVCSTSGRGTDTRRLSAGLKVRAAKDIMCKDVVNIRKQTVLQGQATVVFAGVEGQQQAVACPKVSTGLANTCGQRHGKLTVAYLQDTYILDAGIEAGLELPYTCRAGICG